MTSFHVTKEEVSKSGPPSRVLSLWEWRHWQHKVLPTHVVDHSLRCQHFIKVMELIDGMREENEVRTSSTLFTTKLECVYMCYSLLNQSHHHLSTDSKYSSINQSFWFCERASNILHKSCFISQKRESSNVYARENQSL